MFVFLVRVAADGDDADRRAGGVGDDDGLSGDVVLVLVVTSGAGSLLGFVGPPPSPAGASLCGRAVGDRAVL